MSSGSPGTAASAAAASSARAESASPSHAHTGRGRNQNGSCPVLEARSRRLPTGEHMKLRRWLALFVVFGIAGIAVLSGTEFFGEHGVAYEPAGLYAAQGDPDAGLQQQFAVDQGTFSGDFASCGTNTFSVGTGTQTIDVVASAVVAANDIKLSLLTPAGVEIANVDTGTSPEAIHYSSSSIAAGTWTIKVCPASSGQTNVPPTTYTGSWATQDILGGTPNPPVVGGSDPTAPNAGTPTATYTAGSLRFSPETVVDPQRTEGEPVNFFAKDGTYWESGPFGT